MNQQFRRSARRSLSPCDLSWIEAHVQCSAVQLTGVWISRVRVRLHVSKNHAKQTVPQPFVLYVLLLPLGARDSLGVVGRRPFPRNQTTVIGVEKCRIQVERA